ncbi:MAG: BolA family transcriptional regulator [Rickettsiales bacterium]|nr:BolA family transcriptional regulator [Rickettsiales bacterium]|tara:strand:+ start:1876 stop:2109 length:234 start_codon:yes stop_codon:yes gene_type:complete
MAIPQNELEHMLKEGFPEADIEVQALVDDGDHYKAIIASKQFAGKSRVQQHQMVYASLQGKMGGELHALALETKVKE